MAAPLIGMHFLSFLILAILSVFAALIIHWVIRYRFFAGIDGFFGKWILAWIGAWLGPYVVGHWFAPVMLWNVYIIPGLIGAFVGGFVATAICRASVRARTQIGVVHHLEHHEAA